ncbi:hypothetical protein [Xanthobacter versatilis]|uniref:hypothetical protein n=1 Tax=Xanthobacter autotrophicus (strain ATCC BAA-1158 / Py2) TaxID=78245 RepID=UPI0037267180
MEDSEAEAGLLLTAMREALARQTADAEAESLVSRAREEQFRVLVAALEALDLSGAIEQLTRDRDRIDALQKMISVAAARVDACQTAMGAVASAAVALSTAIADLESSETTAEDALETLAETLETIAPAMNARIEQNVEALIPITQRLGEHGAAVGEGIQAAAATITEKVETLAGSLGQLQRRIVTTLDTSLRPGWRQLVGTMEDVFATVGQQSDAAFRATSAQVRDTALVSAETTMTNLASTGERVRGGLDEITKLVSQVRTLQSVLRGASAGL